MRQLSGSVALSFFNTGGRLPSILLGSGHPTIPK